MTLGGWLRSARFIRCLGALALCFCAFSATACHQTHSPQTSDSNTNWLTSCDGDRDCTGDSSCLCGLCTRPCSAAWQCRVVASDAQCVSTQDPSLSDRCEGAESRGVTAVCATGAAGDSGISISQDASSVVGDDNLLQSRGDAMTSNVDSIAPDASLDASTDGSMDASSSDACITCMNGGVNHCGSGRVTCSCPLGISGSRCENIKPVRQIVAGDHHTCVLLAPSRIKCWGNNDHGQLGVGDTFARGDDAAETPASLAEVDLGTSVVVDHLVAGGAHTCAVFVDGSVRCWGDNSAGQLGLGDTNARGDQPGEMGTSLPALALSSTVIRSLAAGADHTCLVHDDQLMACWGGNASGQLGLGNTLQRGDDPSEDLLANSITLGKSVLPLRLSAGDGFTCAQLTSLDVKCWGDNSNGQLGLGDTLARGDDLGELGDVLGIAAIGDQGNGVQDVVARGHHACVRFDTGVRCWGKNDAGQALLGTTGDIGDEAGEIASTLADAKLTGIPDLLVLGTDHACVAMVTGELSCWGDNSAGQLGLGDTNARGDEAGEVSDGLPHVSLPAGSITGLALGASHTCVVLDYEFVTCWGANASGELARGNTTIFGDDASELPASLPKLTF